MDSLFSLAEGIRQCTACPLYKSRTLAVPGEGNSKAKVMIVGEAPGVEEDRQGLPFVGRSGKLLHELLKGIDQKRLFITSAVKCHPLKNRNPLANELKTCKNLWLDKQIELIKPGLIVILGRVALKSLLNKSNISSVHGKIIKKDGQKYFITYHPAAALRFPKIKVLLEKDFKKLVNIL